MPAIPYSRGMKHGIYPTDLGAQVDGLSDCSTAIQQAIDEAAKAGGGTVIIGPGHWRSGMLTLRTGVTLHLERGALLQALPEPSLFPVIGPTPGNNLPGVIRAFIYADGARHIAITGSGVIHGNGDAELWGDMVLAPEAEFRPAMLFLRECRDVLLRDVNLHYSTFWTCHLLRCQEVLIDAIDIISHPKRINVDGIDPDGCRNVRIRGCTITTTDDAICIKSTEGDECSDIVVSDCVLSSRCCALKVGTEGLGDVRRVMMHHCIVRDSSMGIALYQKDGSIYEDISITDCMLVCRDRFPIYIEVLPRYASEPTIGQVRRVRIHQVNVAAGGRMYLRGHPQSPLQLMDIRGLRWMITDYENMAAAEAPHGARRVEIDPNYPDDANMPFHILLSHCQDSRVEDVSISEDRADQGADRGLCYLRDCEASVVQLHHRLSGEPPLGWSQFLRSDDCRLSIE